LPGTSQQAERAGNRAFRSDTVSERTAAPYPPRGRSRPPPGWPGNKAAPDGEPWACFTHQNPEGRGFPLNVPVSRFPPGFLPVSPEQCAGPAPVGKFLSRQAIAFDEPATDNYPVAARRGTLLAGCATPMPMVSLFLVASVKVTVHGRRQSHRFEEAIGRAGLL